METTYEDDIIEQVRYTVRYRIEALRSTLEEIESTGVMSPKLREEIYQIGEFITSIAKEDMFHSRLRYKSSIDELWALVRNYQDKDYVVHFVTKLTTELKFKLRDKWKECAERVSDAYALKILYTDEQYKDAMPNRESVLSYLKENDWLLMLSLINLAGDI